MTCSLRQEEARWLSRGRGELQPSHASLPKKIPLEILYHPGNLNDLIVPCDSVRYEDPGAVVGLAGALDTRLQVTAGVCSFSPKRKKK